MTDDDFVADAELFTHISACLFVIFESVCFNAVVDIFYFSVLNSLFSEQPFSGRL